jgi:hypothetical protein
VIELLPTRALAVLNATRTLGLPARADPAELTARTWLGGTPEPWTTDFSTLYAMTHTVFHLTDWGAHPDGLPEHLQAYLQAWLPAWLEVYLEAGQWDLISELLIVDLCLTEPAYQPNNPTASYPPAPNESRRTPPRHFATTTTPHSPQRSPAP